MSDSSGSNSTEFFLVPCTVTPPSPLQKTALGLPVCPLKEDPTPPNVRTEEGVGTETTPKTGQSTTKQAAHTEPRAVLGPRNL